MLKTRVISAIVGLPLIIGVLLFGGNLLYLFVFLLSVTGLYEYYKAFSNTDYKPISWVGYLITIIYYILIYFNLINHINFSILIFIALLLVFLDTIKREYNIINAAITTLGIIYVPLLFSSIIFIYNDVNGKILVWLPFLTAWFSDTGAYFIGSYFGKKKLCPLLSPKKTVEGALGGIAISALLSALVGAVFNNMDYEMSIIHFVIIGLICGLTSIIGDLFASSIKRFSHLKDYSNLIPGHGGILDRFDSILFTAPTVYTYVIIIKNFL
ncbi:phosphatidate cytidylyltransferase [Lutispora thermophila]|uniref:Phosphatidate cytidylyltransferase n=1 Tax=Lutispora thermophila DSM 19022 TaxID=1122184 RepID=A0A1M6I4H1_9FIRM|nr:phosphatidate cytidylyltransferase [Lutispora thermophila]SHJ29305.1 phosphatidate cytidylyltransferase [Lutispora thermophila DSM 19022]